MNKYNIFYVDDSPLNLEVFQEDFSDTYNVQTCNCSRSCLEKIIKARPDLIILDVHMPHMSGMDLLQKIREEDIIKDIPVMLYSVDDSDENLVNGLSLGPEDFLLRSMSKAHIKARIDSRLDSFQKSLKASRSFMNVTLELNDYSVKVDDQKVSLTLIEFKILDFLLKNHETRVMKEELIESVWNTVNVQPRTLNTHLSNLRSKIKNAGFQIKMNRNNQILLLPQKGEH
ncbi:MAG: hypothetical protein CME69_07105 [Halobacteriovorax sp.]|nr:hypothetical protein [Halobacteriovorax sp.]